MNTKQVQEKLIALGWPIKADGDYGPATREAVTDFQRGYTFIDLMIDGQAGQHTWDALDWSVWFHGAASPHFKFSEFKSHGNGWIKVHRELLRALEKYRAIAGGFAPVSGYRDLRYNQAIKGATNSQHLYGNACDTPARVKVAAVKALGVFSGIGYNQSTGLVAHVDVRHVGPNTTHSSVLVPEIWKYGR